MFSHISDVRFLAIAIISSCLVFLFPIGNAADISRATQAFDATAPTVMIGNSVIDATSKCELNSHSVARILQDSLGKPVADLSGTGQLLDESLAYAGAALRNSRVKTIIMPLSVFSFTDDWTPTVQREIFLSLISPVAKREFPRGKLSLLGRDPTVHEPFVYNGTAYPDYNGIKVRYFQPERDAMTCPENDGPNRAFLEAYYNHIYAALPILRRNIAAVADFVSFARARKVDVQVVILPVDYDLMRTLDPKSALEAMNNVTSIRSGLARFGISMVDLSRAATGGDFIDRWCACGHMQYSGRVKVAHAIAEALGGG